MDDIPAKQGDPKQLGVERLEAKLRDDREYQQGDRRVARHGTQR